ncbi:hypothetical protein ACES2I_08840 [Bdellovibrio bacteriovorus]|uniref:hypothetical protein n=1 Tax=Bdellovibrio bacteriovorus TaxID=959 RepID=UPI0035A66067
MNKKVLNIVGATAGGIVGLILSTTIMNYTRMSSARNSIEEQNKQLPKKVDEFTTLLRMNLNDKTLEYVYEVDPKVSPEALKANMPMQLQLGACKMPEIKSLLAHFDLKFTYQNPSKAPVADFSLPKGYCKD